MATITTILVLGGLAALILLAVRQTKVTREKMINEIEEAEEQSSEPLASANQTLNEVVQAATEIVKTAQVTTPKKKRRGRPASKKKD